MSFYFNFGEYFSDRTCLVNDKGGSNNPHIGFAVEFLFLPDPILQHHFFIGIGNESEREVIFFYLLLVPFR